MIADQGGGLPRASAERDGDAVPRQARPETNPLSVFPRFSDLPQGRSSCKLLLEGSLVARDRAGVVHGHTPAFLFRGVSRRWVNEPFVLGVFHETDGQRSN